jgi:hypothetical protein
MTFTMPNCTTSQVSASSQTRQRTADAFGVSGRARVTGHTWNLCHLTVAVIVAVIVLSWQPVAAVSVRVWGQSITPQPLQQQACSAPMRLRGAGPFAMLKGLSGGLMDKLAGGGRGNRRSPKVDRSHSMELLNNMNQHIIIDATPGTLHDSSNSSL